MMIQRAAGKTFELKIERRIEAPRERVFRAFIDVSSDARDEHRSGWSSCYDRLVEMFS